MPPNLQFGPNDLAKLHRSSAPAALLQPNDQPSASQQTSITAQRQKAPEQVVCHFASQRYRAAFQQTESMGCSTNEGSVST